MADKMYNPFNDPLAQDYIKSITGLVGISVTSLNLVALISVIERQTKGKSAEKIERLYKDNFFQENTNKVDEKINKIGFYVMFPGRYLGYKLYGTYRRLIKK